VTGRYDITYREAWHRQCLYGLGPAVWHHQSYFPGRCPNFRDTETGGAQANISYTFDSGVQLINIAAWKHMTTGFSFDSDETQYNFFNTNSAHQNYNQFSEELRLALPRATAPAGPGCTHFHSQLNQQNLLGGNNGLPSFLLPTFPFCVGATSLARRRRAVSNTSFLGQDSRFTLKQNSFAGYGQVSYGLTDARRPPVAASRMTRPASTCSKTPASTSSRWASPTTTRSRAPMPPTSATSRPRLAGNARRWSMASTAVATRGRHRAGAGRQPGGAPGNLEGRRNRYQDPLFDNH
jgi:hypothetical protein